MCYILLAMSLTDRSAMARKSCITCQCLTAQQQERERGGGERRCAKTTMTSSAKRTRMRTLVCRANSLLQSRRRRRCCWQFVKQSTKPEIAQAEGGVEAGVRQRIAPRWQRFALEPCERLLPNLLKQIKAKCKRTNRSKSTLCVRLCVLCSVCA